MVAAPVQDSALEVVHDQIRPLPGPRLGLPTMGELEQIKTYAELVVASGMAPKHIDKWETAAVIMRYGHQLGVDEFTALQNMYVVGGKPSMMASLMHAMILRDHGDDAVVIIESTPARCELRCKRRTSHQSSTVTYTMDEANAAGLPTKNAVWKAYPADMLFARAISRAGRQVFRDTTMGLHVPEEIGGNVIEAHGEIVEIPAQAQPDQQPAASEPAEPMATKAQLTELADLGKRLGLDKAGIQAKIGKAGKDLTADEAQHQIYIFKLDVMELEGGNQPEPADGSELPGMPADLARYDS